MNTLRETMTNERQAMNYNINVIKFVWRQLRKPTRVTLDAATLPAPLNLWNIGTNSGACVYVAKFTKDASNADLDEVLTILARSCEAGRGFVAIGNEMATTDRLPSIAVDLSPARLPIPPRRRQEV